MILGSDDASIDLAVKALNAGRIVILPADTVYGFFGSILHPEAVEGVYRLKGRQEGKPFGIYSRPDRVDEVAVVTPSARRLMDRFWPQALALVLPRRAPVTDLVARGQDSVAVITARNRVMTRVLDGVEVPIFGTSCNRSGEPEPSTVDGVLAFEPDVELIIGDDDLPIWRSPSTMVNCIEDPPRVIRELTLTLDDLRDEIPATCRDYSLLIR